MTIDFTVSPDFPPDAMAGWFVFNTFLQRQLGDAIHLELYDTFELQREAIAAGKVDLIYANPFDAAELVREHGFRGVARPGGIADEAVLVVPAESSVEDVTQLESGCRVAHTDDPAVFMIGLIMLEPADLGRSNIEIIERGSYPLVAKALLSGEADVGVFLDDAFEGLSGITRKRLHPLVSSRIDVIHHVFMVGRRLAERADEIQEVLTGAHTVPEHQNVIEGLGFSEWLPVEAEETEFMIDLMDTLRPD